MSRLLYYLVLLPVSYLPWSVLYLISDAMFIIVFKVFGYRASVVFKNLESSFPEKSKAELHLIQKEFYIHLCDVIIETIKLFSVSEAEVKSRFKITNPEIFNKLYKKGRSLVLVGGHYNNWEMAAIGFDLVSPHQAIGIYSPLSSKFFERKFNESRTKYGVEIVAKSHVPRSFISNKDRLTMTIFGADQSPTGSHNVHWMKFLNQETAVYYGTEIFAVKYNYPVVFIKINKVKRGYYEGELKILSENPSETIKGDITELHTKYLEKAIIEKPQFWLWSHKRWKRNMTDEEREVVRQKNKTAA